MIMWKTLKWIGLPLFDPTFVNVDAKVVRENSTSTDDHFTHQK